MNKFDFENSKFLHLVSYFHFTNFCLVFFIIIMMITISNVLWAISNLKIQEKYIVIYVSYLYYVAYLFLLSNCIVIFIHKQDCNDNMLNEVTLCEWVIIVRSWSMLILSTILTCGFVKPVTNQYNVLYV